MQTKLLKPAKATAPDAADKGTTWSVPDGEIAEAIEACAVLSAEIATAKTKLDAAKEIVETYAGKRYIAHWASYREPAAAPLKVVTAEGQSVLYIVSDRSNGYAPNAKCLSGLTEAIGSFEPIEAALTTTTSHTFSEEILALPVRDPVSKRKVSLLQWINRIISPRLEELVTSGELERGQAEALVVATASRTFDSTFVPSLPTLCERDQSRLVRAVAAMGSAIVRFCKPG